MHLTFWNTAYAQSMDEVVSTIYDLVNRKFFSLPKLMLLPGIMMRQPLLVAQITPFIFGSDFINAKILAFLTTSIEKYKKESMEIQSVRSKVESFDMKNADLLQRSGVGATAFTQKKWEELTVSIQQKTFMASLLTRTKRFFNWIQHHFVFSVMIDCALAQLIAAGKIVSAEIFVFSRAIEDAVDTVLMRSRAESELARMLTQIDKLKELANAWEKSRRRLLLPCLVSPHDVTHTGIVLKNLHYSRGSASVSVDHLNIDPGASLLPHPAVPLLKRLTCQTIRAPPLMKFVRHLTKMQAVIQSWKSHCPPLMLQRSARASTGHCTPDQLTGFIRHIYQTRMSKKGRGWLRSCCKIWSSGR